MKYDVGSLPIEADGRVVLPCCGAKLRNPLWPIYCGCGQGLAKRMDECPHRGQPTGVDVPCGCPSQRQPVFQCQLHGVAVRYVCSESKFAGMMCPRCPETRKLMESMGS